MKRRTVFVCAGAAWAACVVTTIVALTNPAAVGQPASGTSGGPAAVRSHAAAPTPAGWDKALGYARQGHFDEAIGQFEHYVKAKPDDATAVTALKLLKQHRSHRAPFDKERVAELEEAGRRVRQAMLAQDHQPKLAEAKLDDKLRERVQEAIVPYNEAGRADVLLELDAEAAKALRKRTLESYDKSRAPVEKAAKLLKGDDSKYAKTFGALVRAYLSRLTAQRKAWASADCATQASRRAAFRTIDENEDKTTAALGDVETMVSKKPWRVAMMQARLAKQIAVAADRLGEKAWYRTFITRMERRAKKAVAAAAWYDALAVHAGLHELDPYSAEYRRMLRTVRRHVRVLGLYGQNGRTEDDNGNGGSTTRPADDEEPTWKEVVAGVDVDMIEKAIEQLDGYYVTSVDYRKVTRGGLRSVKVLAETPQTWRTFPALGDKDKRLAFLKAIDRQLETVQKRDRVDHLDLQLALNAVLRASERTVKIPTEVLAVEFTDGFLDELDKFSSMIWPNDVTDFQKHTMGHFFGVGIQITKEAGEPLKVVTPLAGSPAFRAGIKTNDLIIAVDGKRTESMSIDKLVRRITGPKDTKVVLRIRRAGVLKPFDVSIVREEIRIRTVKGWRRQADGTWNYLIDPGHGIAYIRLTQFTDQTCLNMDRVLTKLQRQNVRSLILDVRFNPGGLLRAAAKAADEFLDAGRIVSTRGLQTQQTEVNARPAGRYLHGDLVVLVNRHSASAAEILAGAIQDRKRGLIVGERTFGKGSVQNVIPIRKHRALLKLTTAYYYLPLGRCLHRLENAKSWGVDPDVGVHITPRQIKRWLDIRRKTDLIQEIDPQELTRDLKDQYQSDVQLKTAVLLLRLMQLNHGTQEKKAA